MDEALVTGHWCHQCLLVVNPVTEVEIKCPYCDGGFVEEIDGWEDLEEATDLGSDRAFSLWEPIWIGGYEEEEEEDGLLEWVSHLAENDPIRYGTPPAQKEVVEAMPTVKIEEPMCCCPVCYEDFEVGEEAREMPCKHKYHGICILKWLEHHSTCPVCRLQMPVGESKDSHGGGNGNTEDGVTTVLDQVYPVWEQMWRIGSYEEEEEEDEDEDEDDLLEFVSHLSENDPIRYGTPPAEREAVEALPTVRIKEPMCCCPVCLEDFGVGEEAREMPCKHKYHSGCILQWLELCSSCPVCRYQMPVGESKDSNGDGTGNTADSAGGDSNDGDSAWNWRRFWLPHRLSLFDGLFSSSGSQSNGNSSSARQLDGFIDSESIYTAARWVERTLNEVPTFYVSPLYTGSLIVSYGLFDGSFSSSGSQSNGNSSSAPQFDCFAWDLVDTQARRAERMLNEHKRFYVSTEDNSGRSLLLASKHMHHIGKIPLARYLLGWRENVINAKLEMNPPCIVEFFFSRSLPGSSIAGTSFSSAPCLLLIRGEPHFHCCIRYVLQEPEPYRPQLGMPYIGLDDMSDRCHLTGHVIRGNTSTPKTNMGMGRCIERAGQFEFDEQARAVLRGI